MRHRWREEGKKDIGTEMYERKKGRVNARNRKTETNSHTDIQREGRDRKREKVGERE